MSEHQQSKEYIITESELEDLHAMSHGAYERQVIEIHQRVHTRLHTPAPAQRIEKYPGCNGICAFEPWEREAIARKAREDVLDELKRWVESQMWHGTKTYPIAHKAPRKKELLDIIESLRSTQQQAGDGDE